MKDKILFVGFAQFIEILKDRLLIKKTVIGEEYHFAVRCIMLELFPCQSESSDACEDILKYLEEKTDIIEWYNNI